jgi:hypothetical protein
VLLTAPFGDGEVDIQLVKPDSGTPVPSGSMSFEGNVLAFHTLDGEPFSVTYTTVAEAAALTEQPNSDADGDGDADADGDGEEEG